MVSCDLYLGGLEQTGLKVLNESSEANYLLKSLMTKNVALSIRKCHMDPQVK